MTAQDVIQNALRLIGSLQSGETAEAAELTDGLATLNALIASWNGAIKKSLAGSFASYLYSYTALSTYATTGTTVTESDGLVRALVFNLAAELAAEYGRALPQEVAANAVVARASITSIPLPGAAQ